MSPGFPIYWILIGETTSNYVGEFRFKSCHKLGVSSMDIFKVEIAALSWRLILDFTLASSVVRSISGLEVDHWIHCRIICG